ncbi:MAG: aminotransferase class IV [Solirubrobacterales bacterium]
MGEPLKVSIDGQLLDPGEASISVLDDGLLRGDGVFEAIKLYDGHPFRLDAHLDRLARSAAAIDLPFDGAGLRREIGALLAAAGPIEAMLRIVVTRGGRRILMVERIPSWPARARVALVPLTPSEILSGVKSISYAANMHATRIASKQGADEAVYLNAAGIVLEAPTSSVFWVGADGGLRTPALETGILDSITREVVVAALPCEEGAFPAADLKSAEEAFLASTTREIQPISAVDGIELARPDGGSAAADAAAALAEALAAERGSPEPGV